MHDALAYHSGGDDSDIAIGTIFSDEINRVPNVFFRERFSCRYIRLVKRDFDRFARLISAPAHLTFPHCNLGKVSRRAAPAVDRHSQT